MPVNLFNFVCCRLFWRFTLFFVLACSTFEIWLATNWDWWNGPPDGHKRKWNFYVFLVDLTLSPCIKSILPSGIVVPLRVPHFAAGRKILSTPERDCWNTDLQMDPLRRTQGGWLVCFPIASKTVQWLSGQLAIRKMARELRQVRPPVGPPPYPPTIRLSSTQYVVLNNVQCYDCNGSLMDQFVNMNVASSFDFLAPGREYRGLTDRGMLGK